jgi:hypothetical protein
MIFFGLFSEISELILNSVKISSEFEVDFADQDLIRLLHH